LPGAQRIWRPLPENFTLLVQGIEKKYPPENFKRMSNTTNINQPPFWEKSSLFPKTFSFLYKQKSVCEIFSAVPTYQLQIRGEEFAPATSDRSAALSF